MVELAFLLSAIAFFWLALFKVFRDVFESGRAVKMREKIGKAMEKALDKHLLAFTFTVSVLAFLFLFNISTSVGVPHDLAVMLSMCFAVFCAIAVLLEWLVGLEPANVW